MGAFPRFKNEIWCMVPADVDKLVKQNNGGKNLLVRQDLFDRSVNAIGMKIKDSQGTVKAFSHMITKKNRRKMIWVERGPKLLERLKSFVLRRVNTITLL